MTVNFDSYYDEPEHDAYCEICGEMVDNCECPECPTCGEAGNVNCIAEHGLNVSAQLLKHAKHLNDETLRLEYLSEQEHEKLPALERAAYLRGLQRAVEIANAAMNRFDPFTNHHRLGMEYVANAIKYQIEHPEAEIQEAQG